MTSQPLFTESQKLTVLYRVEPGCLGPQGATLIDAFCEYAQHKIPPFASYCINLSIVPRNDKKLPEVQYHIIGKNMRRAQVDKYLQLFGKSLEEFETHLENELTTLIDSFLSR